MCVCVFHSPHIWWPQVEESPNDPPPSPHPPPLPPSLLVSQLKSRADNATCHFMYCSGLVLTLILFCDMTILLMADVIHDPSLITLTVFCFNAIKSLHKRGCNFGLFLKNNLIHAFSFISTIAARAHMSFWVGSSQCIFQHWSIMTTCLLLWTDICLVTLFSIPPHFSTDLPQPFQAKDVMSGFLFLSKPPPKYPTST